jgi:hypothetical protein
MKSKRNATMNCHIIDFSTQFYQNANVNYNPNNGNINSPRQVELSDSKPAATG